jgi:hypothetical protein
MQQTCGDSLHWTQHGIRWMLLTSFFVFQCLPVTTFSSNWLVVVPLLTDFILDSLFSHIANVGTSSGIPYSCGRESWRVVLTADILLLTLRLLWWSKLGCSAIKGQPHFCPTGSFLWYSIKLQQCMKLFCLFVYSIKCLGLEHEASNPYWTDFWW